MTNYPQSFDNEHNLFSVQDSLRAILAYDYHPGDDTIHVEGDISGFPATGIITLIDQVSDAHERAVSFHYRRKTQDSFTDLEITEDSQDCFKPRKLTSVLMQVRAEQHNAIKDAVIAIEKFLGTRKKIDKEPFGPTLIGRLNFINKLIHSPKAWFTADCHFGLVPFTVKFESQSHGTTGHVGEVMYEWNFGDGSTETTFEPFVEKMYTTAGIYDVSLTVKNAYGTDTVVLHQFIKAKTEAPDEVVIKFQPQEGQLLVSEAPPVLRTPVGQIVVVDIPSGENPNTPGITYAGEALDDDKRPIDPITNYTWACGDDLPHANSRSTKLGYNLGGLHDLVVRTDTLYGAYRITTYPRCVDVMETTNLWLWADQGDRNIRAFEFSLNGEEFKAKQTTGLAMKTFDAFLDNAPNSSMQKHEFHRNCGAAPLRMQTSGAGGTSLLFWASGRAEFEPVEKEDIEFMEYNGFTDTYIQSAILPIPRIWNWASLVSPTNVYIILGNTKRQPAYLSPTNQSKVIIDTLTTTHSEVEFEGYNYINGAQELQHNNVEFDHNGDAVTGHFSILRTAWRGFVGYILRNEYSDGHSVLKSFYKTDGNLDEPFMSLAKLVNVPGAVSEGQLVALESGVYLFSNMNAALLYEDASGTWQTTPTRSSILDGDYKADTLLATSDHYHRAYLSFDYSSRAFVKFTDTDLTFSTLGMRPQGKQWQLLVY